MYGNAENTGTRQIERGDSGPGPNWASCRGKFGDINWKGASLKLLQGQLYVKGCQHGARQSASGRLRDRMENLCVAATEHENGVCPPRSFL